MTKYDPPRRDSFAAWRRIFFWLFVLFLAYPILAFAVICLLEALGVPVSHMISMDD
jgi:hypothetical protein